MPDVVEIVVPSAAPAVEVTLTPAPAVIEVLVVQPGPPGPTGPPGNVNELLPLLGYTHTQAIARASWTITHSLPYNPSVTVVDSAGTEVEGGVQFTSPTTIVLTFSGAFSGKAYLS